MKKFFVTATTTAVLSACLFTLAIVGDGTPVSNVEFKNAVAACTADGNTQASCEAWVRSQPAWMR